MESMTHTVNAWPPSGLLPDFTGSILSKVRCCLKSLIFADCPGPEVVENSGGPMSRERREHIRSSLLDNKDSEIRWNQIQIFRVVMELETDPVEHAHQCLKNLGYQTTEDALSSTQILPTKTLHCVSNKLSTCEPDNDQYPQKQSDREFLFNALVLGRCGPTIFNPCGPVIWTRNRLQREVRLYEVENFYE